MFKILSKANIFANIAQILVGIIIFPLLCFVLVSLAPKTFEEVFKDLLSEISFFDVWFGLLPKISQLGSNSLPPEYAEELLLSINETGLSAVFMGVSMEICLNIAELLNIKGIPVIQTITGYFLGCITLRAVKTNDILYFASTILFLVVCSIVLQIFITGNLKSAIIRGMFYPGISILISIAVAAYIAICTIVAKGDVTSFWYGFYCVTVTFFIVVVLLIIKFLIKPENIIVVKNLFTEIKNLFTD